jgi:hypothetical protein
LRLTWLSQAVAITKAKSGDRHLNRRPVSGSAEAAVKDGFWVTTAAKRLEGAAVH